MEYILIKSLTTTDLELQIKEKIKQGYTLNGNLILREYHTLEGVLKDLTYVIVYDEKTDRYITHFLEWQRASAVGRTKEEAINDLFSLMEVVEKDGKFNYRSLFIQPMVRNIKTSYKNKDIATVEEIVASWNC